MPAYTEPQKEQSPRIYWKVVAGAFVNQQDHSQANTIEGFFHGVHVRDDPGKPDKKVLAGKKIGIRIEDGDNLHVIDFRPNIYFASSFASRLKPLTPGDRIKITVKPGTDSDKVSFCNIMRIEGEDWKEVPYEAIDTKDPKVREERVLDLIQSFNDSLRAQDPE